MVVLVTASCPTRASSPIPRSASAERALTYMALDPGTPIQDIEVDRVFIGSWNARIEDLREAASVVAGKQVHPRVRAMVVPGSAGVKRRAEEEGLDRIFEAAGFEWRRGRLLDVPRDEPGHPPARQPQPRRPTATSRAARAAAGGRTRSALRWPLRRRWPVTSSTSARRSPWSLWREAVSPHYRARCRPRPGRRRHRPDHSEAVPEAHRALGLGRVPLLRLDQSTRPSSSTAPKPRAPRSWSPAATSAAAPRASTRPGRSRTTASRSSSRRRPGHLPHELAKVGLLRSRCPRSRSRSSWPADRAPS